MKTRSTILAAILIQMLAIAGALAKDDDDDRQEKAGEAVRAGHALPLARILRDLGPRLGEVLEVELEEDDGILVYEIKYLDDRGRRREAEVDAATGRIVEDGD